jgi:hypothetical protein
MLTSEAHGGAKLVPSNLASITRPASDSRLEGDSVSDLVGGDLVSDSNDGSGRLKIGKSSDQLGPVRS